MENWGAIAFLPQCLELPPTDFLKSYKNLRIIAHEISHMWFGDLVTMKWWDEVWLHEGVARYMEFACLAAIRPHLGVWKRFVADVHCAILRIDFPFVMTHAVKLPARVDWNDSAVQFDSIVYFKGAALMRMLEDIVGEEAFKNGVSRFVKKYEYSNATSEDLFEEMQEGCRYEVRRIMKSWIESPSFPVVTVEKCGGGFRVTQKVHGLETSSAWPIVIKYITDSGNKGEVFIEENEGFIEDNAEWIKVNYLTRGYYRVFYQDYAEIFRNLKSFCVEDRLGILSDSLFHFHHGLVDCEHIFTMINALLPEFEYLVVSMILGFINKLLVDNRLEYYLIPTINKVCRPIWEKYSLSSISEDCDFFLLRELTYSLLIEKCNDEEIKSAILASTCNTKEMKSLQYSCILSEGESNKVLDLVCTDTEFALEVLEKSCNTNLLRFTLNFYRFSWDKESFGYEVVDCLRNKKEFTNGEHLITAALMEFKQEESIMYKFFLKRLALGIAENGMLEYSNLNSFFKECLSKSTKKDFEEKHSLVTSCAMIILRKNRETSGYERVIRYFARTQTE